MIESRQSHAERQTAACVAVLLAVWALCPQTGRATDVYFADFTVLSPDRHLRLQVTSPDNAGSNPGKPFAENFLFRLNDEATRKIIWQKRNLAHRPVWAALRDDGWTVIHSHWSGLTFVDPKGHRTGQRGMLHVYLPPDDVKRYVRMTTAGPIWVGYSHWFFADVGNRPYYCLRTWWKHRVVFDLTTGKTVSAGGKLLRAMDIAEKKCVLATLSDAAKYVRSAGEKGQEDILIKTAHPVAVAAYMAGRLGYSEAVADLRSLEKVNNFGHGIAGAYPEKPGQVAPFTFWTLGVRQMAQLSLRRLGHRPSDRPATELNVYMGKDKKSQPFKPIKHKGPRSKRVSDVRAGQSALEVLRLLGPPDYIDDNKRTWEFDIDTKPPYTLRIQWKDMAVRALEKVIPPPWKVGHTRDEGLNR